MAVINNTSKLFCARRLLIKVLTHPRLRLCGFSINTVELHLYVTAVREPQRFNLFDTMEDLLRQFCQFFIRTVEIHVQI